MQYLVYTRGEVVEASDKVYIVKAPSTEKAKEIAQDNFSKEFIIADKNVVAIPYERTYKAVISVILMLISVGLSCINWKTGHETVCIQPDFFSCLLSLGFYIAFVVRFKSIKKMTSSKTDVVLAVTIILLLSSFVQVILSTKYVRILGIEIPVSSTNILVGALVLSWIGLKLISVICMIGVGILAMLNLSILNSAMGNIYGPVYVVCAFMGILFYLSIEPAAMEMGSYFKKTLGRGCNYIHNDVEHAGNTVKYMKEKAINYKSEISNKSDVNKKIEKTEENAKEKVI